MVWCQWEVNVSRPQASSLSCGAASASRPYSSWFAGAYALPVSTDFIMGIYACCQVYSPQWDIWLMKVYIGRANASPTMGAPLSNRLQPAGLIAIVWFSVALASIFVVARTYLRITRVRGLGYEDFCIHFAYLLLVVNVVLQILQIPGLYYIDRVHAWLQLLGDGDQYIKYEYCILGLFWTILWSVKACWLALYWRLFDGLHLYRGWWKAVALFVFATYAGCWIASPL